MRTLTVAARRGRRWLLAFRAASMLVILLAAGGLHPQETDLIDTRDFTGRAVSFEMPEASYLGLWDLSTVGDVNGDGVTDLGLIRHANRPVYDFSVHLIFGSSQWTGRNIIAPELARSVRFVLRDLEVTPAGPSLVLDTGDLNGDGYAEFAFVLDGVIPIGAKPGYQGVVFIVHGRPAFEASSVLVDDIVSGGIRGTVLYTTNPTIASPGDSAGCVIDINGDRKLDLVLSAFVNGAVDTGAVHVLLDTMGLGPQVDVNDIGGALPGFLLRTPAPLTVLADAGDFDGDGYHDLLVAHGNNFLTRGAVYVFFGRPDPGGTYALTPLSEEGDGVLRFAIPNHLDDEDGISFAQSGSVAAAGDVNGDGFGDILIGESYSSFDFGGGAADSKVHLVYGGPGLPSPIPLDEVPAERRKVFHGIGGSFASDGFGSNVASPGDMNGDGIPDLLFGAPRSDERWDRAGEAYLIHGQRAFADNIFLADGIDGIRIVGDTTLGGLGHHLGPGGDFNADGNPDFLVGEPHLSSARPGGGKAFVVFGTGDGEPPLTLVSIEPRSGFLRGGSRVRLLGSGFREGARVQFGASFARILAVVLPSELLVESPAGAALGEVPVAVTVGGVTRTARDRFEYVPDRPEIDLESPGRWGLRIDSVPGLLVGLGLDFADLDGDGLDDLIIGSDFLRDWVVTVLRGGRSLPSVTDALGPGPAKSLIFKRNDVERINAGVKVRNVGDINGDGVADVGVSVLEESSYLFFGRRGLPPELDIEAEVAAGRAARLLFDASDARLGFAPLGDVTGDGVSDLVLSLSTQSVLFVEGRREWPPALDLRDPGVSFSRLTGEGEAFAANVALAGDVTGDGRPDLLVSGTSDEGSVVYLLDALGPPPALPATAAMEDYIPGGGGVRFVWEGRPRSFAIHLSGAGDVNGDGIGDLLLGDEEGTVITTHEGIAYLVYGRRDFPERIAMPLDLGPVALEGVVRLANASLKQAGRALGATGDYNGDGYSDFTVGAVNLDFFEPWSIDVVFGGPELPPLLELRDLGHRGFSIEGIRPFTALDETTHAAGDLNGDGAPDFAFSEAPLPVAGDAEPSPGSVHVLFGLPPSVPFIRGDADDDGRLNITDGVFTLTFLFLGGIDPPCEDATDTDDRGTIELTDAVYVLNHLFLGGPAPPAPYPDAGVDPTEDRLGCLGY